MFLKVTVFIYSAIFVIMDLLYFQVIAELHHDLKSLVAAVTKGLNSEHLKAHALYCWLASQDLKKFAKVNKKSSSPAGRLKQLSEKKTLYSSVYMDMLK